MPLAPGTNLGPYRVLEKLGEGGMGEVYRAEDSRLRRTVAIKILTPGRATADRVERFEQEARAASALNHPNILTIHDVGREDGTAYFAMEWVDGHTLRELLRSGPIPLRRTVQLAQQIAEGLAKAHAAGIVHRDLKPENVMVTADGLAKIVDFGLAKLGADPRVPLQDSDLTATVTRFGTEPGLVMGTVGYMSPEQASGRAVDYRADQFALGLLLYELITRTRPFERATTAQSMAATIDAEAPPVESINPDVPPHLATVVARCLAKDPAERYESTRDLARDLRSILDGLSRPTWSEGESHAVASPHAARKPSSPRRTIIAIATVALLVTAASAAWLWGNRAASPDQPERPLVAVRPFRSLSEDPKQEYFAAGVTEEIRGQLSQVASLRLLSRNGLDAYKDGEVARAVRELGVQQLVDGSVRVDGNRVRVSAELVDAATQQTIWSETYDRNLADVLTVQSDIAVQIARALHASLTPHEQQRLQKRPTDNNEAYALYLQSQQVTVVNRERNLEAIDLLHKVLALDPRFAVAQARLAYRLVFMGYYDDESYIDKGIAEAEAALRTDGSLAPAYVALATGYGMKGLGAQARQAFLRALELDPNNTTAMNNLSNEEILYGRLDEALYWGRRSFALSGKQGNDFYHLTLPMIVLRADGESRTLLEQAERRFPTYSRVQLMLALLDINEGKTQQALSRIEAQLARAPQDQEASFLRADLIFLLDRPDLLATLEPLMQHSASNSATVAETPRLRYAYGLGKRGESAKAASLVAEAERVDVERMNRGNQSPMLRVELAAAAVLRKDLNGALDWLTKAYDGGYRDYALLDQDPIFAALDGDARFRGLLEQMHKDVDAQRARARERGLLELASPLMSN